MSENKRMHTPGPNARLIAAAPELLAALKRVISDPEITGVLQRHYLYEVPRAFVQARAAIAKAEAR